ncbi:MAG TPA: class I SAM-dependent methyltransferase [Terriglobales bacterium]|nr:class I SAM-dependent methyltransferase [Terriglobales bacterium]
MQTCRNCGSQDVKDVGLKGEIAPFFLKRVVGIELGPDGAVHPVKKLLRATPFLPHGLLRKVYRTAALIDLQICRQCRFVQTKNPFSAEMLGELYRDYRSDSYNSERIRYEPEYEAVAAQVGKDDEASVRVGTLTAWLRDKIDLTRELSMLDYGGADGRFLPKLPGTKYVYEISDMTPVEGVTRIRNADELSTYSYVQVAHVLEHVPDPLEMVKTVANSICKSGYLYIEVPEDIDREKIDRLLQGENLHIPIHEHINFYNLEAVRRVVEAVGLQLIAVQADRLNLGWANTTILRGLGRKP